MKVKPSFRRNPKSIEDKIEYLQEEINWVQQELELEVKGIKEKIDRQIARTGDPNPGSEIGITKYRIKNG